MTEQQKMQQECWHFTRNSKNKRTAGRHRRHTNMYENNERTENAM